ncbi:MAG: hypothetical protein AAGF12_05790 [Myxococcota bacterium]
MSLGSSSPRSALRKPFAEAGVDVEWVPTELGHFGADEVRWSPVGRFIGERFRRRAR